MLFSVQDYINDASKSTPEEETEFTKDCENWSNEAPWVETPGDKILEKKFSLGCL